MNKSESRSLPLCRTLVAIFALLLVLLDAGCVPLVDWFLGFSKETLPATAQNAVFLRASLWAGSLFAWPCLWCLWRLLGNLAKGQVFVADNTRLMAGIGICCAGACVVCLLSAVYYLPWGLLAVAAAFMGLLVAVVRSCFAQAIRMKDELDWTV